MKLLQVALAAGAAMSLCACTVPSAPTAPTAVVTVDAFRSTADFEPEFYRAFLQNGYESPTHLEPVKILRAPIRIYMRTEDDQGRKIDAVTLDTTANALIDSAPIWSGETFGITEIARGSSTRENVPGWITVKWSTNAPAGHCGRSTVGVDGGFIEFNPSGACSCGMTTRVYPRVVRHELGHAMGYYHTDNSRDVMYGKSITSDSCDAVPSERERFHARYAHTADQLQK